MGQKSALFSKPARLPACNWIDWRGEHWATILRAGNPAVLRLREIRPARAQARPAAVSQKACQDCGSGIERGAE